MLPESVEQKLESLPARPGCYLFRDKHGEVLYVGKAKSLRSRVRSYFQAGSSDTRAFIPLLIKNIGDLETLRHRYREGGGDPREQPDQGEQAPLQRQAPRRQGVPDAAPVDGPRVAAAGAGAQAHERRRALLRALPLGDGGAPHAAPGGEALPAPHLLRSRARVAQATVPAVPHQALSGAVRARDRSRDVRRARCARWVCSSTAVTTS